MQKEMKRKKDIKMLKDYIVAMSQKDLHKLVRKLNKGVK